MTLTDDVLDRLAPTGAWEGDWSDVLARAGERRPLVRRVLTRRRLLVALAVVAAAAVPLVALAAANDWWFFRYGGAPRPVKAPVVVKEGEWSGHSWQLVAYPSRTDGLCMAIAPPGEGGAMNCSPQVGVARTRETKASPDMTITFLSGGATDELPAYIAGPVLEDASIVVIHLDQSTVLRVPTFSGPRSLGRVRFYATELPTPLGPRSTRFRLVGLDRNGDVVACLVPATAVDGVSPLSDCR
jgi:hypothetical protein